MLMLAVVHAKADIYKSVDEDGRVTYSNVPSKGAQKLILEPLNTVPSSKPSTQPPGNFPKVDAETQKNRDNVRRKILENELAQENKALADAKLALSEAEKDPETFMTTITVMGTDGKPQTKTITRRNVAAYEGKIKPLQESIALHEKNIEALKEELASLK